MFHDFSGLRWVLTTAVLVLCIATANAQQHQFAEKGVTELAGTVSFSSITPVSEGKSGDATTLFSLGPQIGYFPTDGLELGISTGITLLPGISLITPPQGDATTVV